MCVINLRSSSPRPPPRRTSFQKCDARLPRARAGRGGREQAARAPGQVHAVHAGLPDRYASLRGRRRRSWGRRVKPQMSVEVVEGPTCQGHDVVHVDPDVDAARDRGSCCSTSRRTRFAGGITACKPYASGARDGRPGDLRGVHGERHVVSRCATSARARAVPALDDVDARLLARVRRPRHHRLLARRGDRDGSRVTYTQTMLPVWIPNAIKKTFTKVAMNAAVSQPSSPRSPRSRRNRRPAAVRAIWRRAQRRRAHRQRHSLTRCLSPLAGFGCRASRCRARPSERRSRGGRGGGGGAPTTPTPPPPRRRPSHGARAAPAPVMSAARRGAARRRAAAARDGAPRRSQVELQESSRCAAAGASSPPSSSSPSSRPRAAAMRGPSPVRFGEVALPRNRFRRRLPAAPPAGGACVHRRRACAASWRRSCAAASCLSPVARRGPCDVQRWWSGDDATRRSWSEVRTALRAAKVGKSAPAGWRLGGYWTARQQEGDASQARCGLFVLEASQRGGVGMDELAHRGDRRALTTPARVEQPRDAARTQPGVAAERATEGTACAPPAPPPRKSHVHVREYPDEQLSGQREEIADSAAIENGHGESSRARPAAACSGRARNNAAAVLPPLLLCARLLDMGDDTTIIVEHACGDLDTCAFTTTRLRRRRPGRQVLGVPAARGRERLRH